MAGGAVRTSWLEVRKIGEHELVPREDECEDRRRGDAGHEQGQGELPERLQAGVAVEHGGVLVLRGHLVDEPLHHPDRERDVERGVDEDQAELGVDESELWRYMRKIGITTTTGGMKRVDRMKNSWSFLAFRAKRE